MSKRSKYLIAALMLSGIAIIALKLIPVETGDVSARKNYIPPVILADAILLVNNVCEENTDASPVLNHLVDIAAELQQKLSPTSLAGAYSDYGATVEIRFKQATTCYLQKAIFIKGNMLYINGAGSTFVSTSESIFDFVRPEAP